MITVGDKKDCCGCGACSQVCPINCIVMNADDEGFRYPSVDKAKCVDCGSCEHVCPVIRAKTPGRSVFSADKAGVHDPFPKAVGGWIRDEDIRGGSSSGGAFSLFALRILSQGGIVYGAAMDENLTVRHIGIETPEELKQLRESKYVQSIIGNTYDEVRRQLDTGRIVLFSGTPCQAAGLRSSLGEKEYDNLYVMDCACHGIPSPAVFSRYIAYLSEKHHETIKAVHFRMKDKGWNPNGTQLGPGTGYETESGNMIRHSPGLKDSYMNGFLDDTYLRPSCYDCAFRSIPKTYSDITIADFWGVKRSYPELFDGKGTSLVLLNSKHGEELFDTVKDGFHYQEVDFQKAARDNPSLTKSPALPGRRKQFFEDFREKPFCTVLKKHMNPWLWGWHKACSIGWGMIESLIRAVLTPVLSALHMKWDEAKWQSFFQFVRFAMVGVSNVLVSYTVNVCTLLLIRAVKPDLPYDYVIANAVAFLVSVFWSWSWNSRKVFNAELSTPRDKLKSLLRTYASYAFTGLILNNLLSTFWIRVVGVSKFLAPLLNIPISMPINFFIIKKWAYGKNSR